MTGRDFFNSIFEDGKKVDRLCEIPADKQLAWELESVSQFSPGIVVDEEHLVRGVLDPIHLEDDGKIKPALFDDLLTHGLSVHRLSHSDLQTIMSMELARVEKFNAQKTEKQPARALAGYILLRVKELRAQLSGNRRLIGVYDTALDVNRHHAESCALLGGKQFKRSARAALFEIGKNSYSQATVTNTPNAATAEN